MSWDVYVARFPADLATPEEIPDGWMPEPLGTGAEVRRALSAAVPGIAFLPDGQVVYDGDGVSMSTSLTEGDDEECLGLLLFFHGGSAATGLAIAVTEGLQARGIETGNGGFLDRETAGDGWQEWQSYRDHVLKSDDLTDTRD